MTVTQNYGNIILSTPILSADPNVKEDVMTDQQKITILYCRLSNEDSQDGESNSIQNQYGIGCAPKQTGLSHSLERFSLYDRQIRSQY